MQYRANRNVFSRKLPR